MGLRTAFAAALLLRSAADAARVCGSDAATPASFQWRVGDVRWDSADPQAGKQFATMAASIVPGLRGSFFECVAEWPQSWAGWYEGGSNIIWSDCIWSGAGPTYDRTVSFAVDWTNRTMYLSHTFACSNQQGTDALATGTTTLDMNCTTTAEGVSRCIPKNAGARGGVSNITTTQTPARLNASSACADSSTYKRYQSWEVVGWARQYEMVPASEASGSASSPPMDSGPSFTLRSMATSDVFHCAPSGKRNDTFAGSCTSVALNSTSDAATYSFDPKLDMITITQHWNCSGSPSFDAVGVGYIQALCDRTGDMLSCSADPLWVGTKTL